MAQLSDAAGFTSVVYFMERAMNDPNSPIFEIDWERTTHVNYAFGKPAPDGSVGLYDPYAAVEITYPQFGVNNSFGLDFVRIDWEYPTEGGNNQSVVPHRPNDIANYLKVLQLFRQELAKLPWKAELSVASPAGSDNYRHWDFTVNCGLQDHINIMTYDLAGDWSAYTDHQAKLYKDPNHPAGKEYSVHGAVQDYLY
ncbi:hypothetical protein B5M09_010514 [Aphanomyces astaci]|uniref:GH18 domain-containing protein n=1 Tax=Aphanomyces astaci TaxID=112090 RepID=A0A3R7YIT1_APHAT|nr:hypothetical protein B5M09_010514 [Aphanomyces astaci]